MATTPVVATTYNTDIYGLYRRINRAIEEVVKSVSSSVSQTSAFDVTRAKSYISAVRAYTDWVVAQPVLDLPETAPQAMPLAPASPTIPFIENESLFDLATLLSLARDELVGSQSARMPANLIKFDESRLRAVLAKADAFINDYITVVDPLDLPESSPMAAVSGPGRTGV